MITAPDLSPVNREDRPIALYEHVKRRISDAILEGRWQAGTVLPNEGVLAAQFGVAIGTLRRALSDLVSDGMLLRRRKTGTVVTGRSPKQSLRFFFRYFRLHGIEGQMLSSETEVLSLDRVLANSAQAKALQRPPGTKLILLKRVRRIENIPVMHEMLLLPSERLPDFPLVAIEVPALLYLHLSECYAIHVTAARESLTATLASAADRRILGLPNPSAVLRIDEVAFDQGGNPIILAEHFASTARHVYINEVR